MIFSFGGRVSPSPSTVGEVTKKVTQHRDGYINIIKEWPPSSHQVVDGEDSGDASGRRRDGTSGHYPNGGFLILPTIP